MATRAFVQQVRPRTLPAVTERPQESPRPSALAQGSSSSWAAAVAALGATAAGSSRRPEVQSRIHSFGRVVVRAKAAKGFATAEWMEDTAASDGQAEEEFGREASAPSTSKRSIVPKSSSSSAIRLSDGRRRRFDPGVLRDAKGEVIGGGDAPEPEGAKELYEWMEAKGCTGLDDVQLLLGGGVALRRKSQCGSAKQDQELLSIPKEAWLRPTRVEDFASLEHLAWRFLKEMWAEDDSDFAPFVRHLRRQDLSFHPIFWEEDEIDWLSPSPEGFEAVLNMRGRTKDRAARLAARSTAEAPEAAGRYADEKELLADIRWALALVESRSFEAKDDEGNTFVALAPIIGDIKLSTRGPDVVSSEVEGDRLVLSAKKLLRPGEEMFNKVYGRSSASLLATCGVVPGAEQPGVPSDSDLAEINHSATCWLPCPETDSSDYPRETYMGTKIKLLVEYAGLEVRGPRVLSTPCKDFCFVLPDEAVGTGRLLPVSRFLIADVAGMGGDVEMWMDRWFVRFFRHCKLERYPSRHVEESASDEEEVQKVLTMVHDTQIEITARRVACTWLEQAVLEKNQMIEKIAGRTGLPVGNSDGVIVVQEGQTVTAYFKAKRRDGSIGKSKTPREAVVVSLNEDTIRVKFVASKARHEIPMNWVVSSTPVPDPRLLSEGCSPERLARGKLAITLLRTEKAIAGFVLESFSQAADLLEELSRGVEGCRAQDDEEGYRKLLKIIQSFLDQEMVEVDEELQQVLPQSLADIPSDPGHKQFLDKPLYSVPEGYLDPKFTNDMMLLDGEDTSAGSPPGDSSSTAEPADSS